MKRKRYRNWLIAMIGIVTIGTFTGCMKEPKIVGNEVHITNVSYDSTREFYEDYNRLFREHYKAITGKDVHVTQSHGGSSAQARSIIEGNDADIVSLGSSQDIEMLNRVHLLDANWENMFPNHSSPYTSTIVFLVRKGNPQHIQDWSDLERFGISIVAPDPKSSSAACWIFMAAWDHGLRAYGTETGAKGYVKALYDHVKVLDAGARSAATTFVENKQGDVLLIWENEALQIVKNYPGQYEVVTPSTSIVAEPNVALVKGITDRDQTTEVARDYIQYLYSDEGQRLIGSYGFRPSNPVILQEFSSTFNHKIELTTIHAYGGWDAVYKKFFDEGGVFDEIYGT